MAKDEHCAAEFSVEKRQNLSNTFQQEDLPASSTRSANDDTVSVTASNVSGSSNATGLVDSGDEDEDGSPAMLRLLARGFENSEREAIRRFQKHFFIDKNPKLKTFDPEMWRPAFLTVFRELLRLQNLEHEWNTWCPAADRYIFETGPVAVKDSDGLLDHFREIWSHDDSQMSNPNPKRRERVNQSNKLVKWQNDSVIWQEQESELCVRHGSLRLSEKYVSYRISSQLLLYRVTVIFGMLPQSNSVDNYKTCWAAKLHHNDGCSLLDLYERKGFAEVAFRGTTGAEIAALELLNFLCGNDIPHTYEGILAGSEA